MALARAAGGVILGKTVSTEFAYFKPGKTANPHNPAHTPGGSFQRIGRRRRRFYDAAGIRFADGGIDYPARFVLRRCRI